MDYSDDKTDLSDLMMRLAENSVLSVSCLGDGTNEATSDDVPSCPTTPHSALYERPSRGDRYSRNHFSECIYPVLRYAVVKVLRKCSTTT